jgi:hypothetical protein
MRGGPNGGPLPFAQPAGHCWNCGYNAGITLADEASKA